MDITRQYHEQQEAKQLKNRIFSFIGDFQVGTLLNKSGIRKLRGVSPLTLFSVIFMLPFGGENFYRGIVTNTGLPFKKNAAYELLKNPCYNWRKFMLTLAVQVSNFFFLLTSKERERVLIFDDSTYDRSRSKVVELLAWIFDHNSGTNLKGFKLLTLGWSDGASFLPLDFVLCSSAKTEKRVQGIKKALDKRTCGYKRRMEAITKSTEHLEDMVKRALAFGVEADYILMDSWFCWPAILAKLGQHLPVICMAKNMPKVFYRYKGQWVTLGALYSRIKKRPGKAKILASVIVETKHEQKMKIVFVRHRHKRDWLAIVSTKVDLADEEIVRIYGKRWDIEVFFKMMKHHLNLERETQLRDYDGIIGHTTIAMVRYIFLAFEQRCHDDPKTIGGLFFACSEEIRDISLLEALQRLLAFTLARVRSSGEFAESVIVAMIDAIMGAAIEFIKTNRRLATSIAAYSTT
ncbi:MAG TPA: IS4 family transposase [Gammaproteobacteria bacterium]|nr:IS4 family transposase [Gammaproteobacteria bacterium]